MAFDAGEDKLVSVKVPLLTLSVPALVMGTPNEPQLLPAPGSTFSVPLAKLAKVPGFATEVEMLLPFAVPFTVPELLNSELLLNVRLVMFAVPLLMKVLPFSAPPPGRPRHRRCGSQSPAETAQSVRP